MATQAELTSSYRTQLDQYWGICARSDAEVERMLPPRDRDEYRNLRKAIAKGNAKAPRRLYQWMATPERFGAVHSVKWAEILSSGVWAANALARLGVSGLVVDIGCNAGYWPSWFSGETSCTVLGIEQSEEVVAFGKAKAQAHSLPLSLRCGDFTTPLGLCADAVVSLQGLTHFFVRRDFSVLSRVTQHVRPGGYLVLVDEFTPTDATHLAEGLDRAELEIVGTGMVGAPGGVYCALITRRTHGTAIHGTAATRLLEAIDIVSQEVWPIFQGYCDVIEANDPSARDKMNSAYFGYARDSVIMF